MSIKADATLVNAAYRMGMANVPADTSRIFQQQYEALAGIEKARLEYVGDVVTSAGKLAETGVKTYARIKDFEQRKEWHAKADKLYSDYFLSNAPGWKDHKRKVDPATEDDATARIEAIKGEVERVEAELARGARTPEQVKRLTKLKKAVIEWQNEMNERLAVGDIHFDNYANNRVDMNRSFIDTNTNTQSSLLMGVYNDVMSPSVDLRDANVIIQFRNGERGYLYNKNRDNLAIAYRNSKQQDNPDTSIDNKKELASIPEEDAAWISHKELMGMVKLKDRALEVELNGLMTNVSKTFLDKNKVNIRNADGTISASKKSRYVINDYKKEQSQQNIRGYYDILRAETRVDGDGNTITRDWKGGIDYINNNIIQVAGKDVNYREHSKLNPEISKASYASLGLTGSVDLNGNNILEGDELTDEDKTIIHNRLMNPQSIEEYEIAAMEIAKYYDFVTEELYNSTRANDIDAAGAPPPPPGGIVKKDTIPLWGQDVPKATDSKMRRELALVGQIAKKYPTLIIDDKYKYKWNDKENKYVEVWTKIRGEKNYPEDPEKFTREQMIREYGGEIYGNIPVGYDFGDSKKDDKSKTKTFDPMEVTIEQMKSALPQAYDLKNKTDEEIRKLYKKWVISLMPKRK